MKNVLITGVCGGMGSAAARLLIESGYAVYGLDKCDSCAINGVNYQKADLLGGDISAAVAAFDEVEFDAIAHFAGIYDAYSLLEISREEIERDFKINVFGAYEVNKAFFPQLKSGGQIVITTSELAPLDPLPFTGIYGITKTALEKYAETLRIEAALLGVKVSVIRPGAVKTPLLGASNTALDRFCDNTELYSCNADNFRRIVNGVESKCVPPEKIAKTLKRALEAKRPKYVYNINRNFLLRVFSCLPRRFQVWALTKIITKKPPKTRNID